MTLGKENHVSCRRVDTARQSNPFLQVTKRYFVVPMQRGESRCTVQVLPSVQSDSRPPPTLNAKVEKVEPRGRLAPSSSGKASAPISS